MQSFGYFTRESAVLVTLFAAFLFPLSTHGNPPRALQFSGYNWTVRSDSEPTDPGRNTFNSSANAVFVDQDGRLHLSLDRHATEIRSRRSFGYGTYEVRITARLDQLHPRAVLGFFTFELPSNHPHHREIDIEFSRWGSADAPNAQFVVQPADRDGNRLRFALDQPEGSATTHRFEWRPGVVEFISWHGHGEYPPAPHLIVADATIETADVPAPRRERLYLNFWWYQGPSADLPRQTVIIDEFRYSPGSR
jgi:hypothetical protein